MLNSLILNLSSKINFFKPVAILSPVSLTSVANLPPVSTTPTVQVTKFAAGVVDTGVKFVTGVVGTGGAPGLRIFPQIFEKIWNDPKGIF